MEKPLELSASIASVAKGQERDKVALKEGQEKKNKPKEALCLLLVKALDPTWNIVSSAGHCTSVL